VIGEASVQVMPGAAAPSEAIDISVLAGLMDILPAEQVRELVSILISDVESRLDRIAAAESSDLECLKREAHDLKSSCGNFGLVEIARLAMEIETACRSGADHEAHRLARGLHAVADRGIAALRRASGLAD
jgi:HPt (histidine-containing phosphotransfer) domain-containing protein